MRKLLKFLFILILGGFCCACVNTFAVHELNEIAFNYMDNGDYNAAIARYQSSIDLDGEIYESRYNLASALHTVGKCSEAIEHAEIATKLKPKEPISYYTLGTVATCAADKMLVEKKGEKDVEIPLQEFKKSINQVAKYKDNLAKANSAFEVYLELVPNSEDADQVVDMININKEKLEKIDKEPEKKPVNSYYRRY